MMNYIRSLTQYFEGSKEVPVQLPMHWVVQRIIFRKDQGRFIFRVAKVVDTENVPLIHLKESVNIPCPKPKATKCHNIVVEPGVWPTCNCFRFFCQANCQHAEMVMDLLKCTRTQWVPTTSEKPILLILSENFIPLVEKLGQDDALVRVPSSASLLSLVSSGGSPMQCCFCLDHMHLNEKQIKCTTCRLVLHETCWIRWHLTGPDLRRTCPWCNTTLSEPIKFETIWNKDAKSWDVLLFETKK
jgi:hypothetical protein